MDTKLLQLTVIREQTGESLINYLAAVLDISKREAKRIIDSRLVFVNRRRVWIATHKLKGGDRVEVPAPRSKAERAGKSVGSSRSKQSRSIPVLFHENGILVANKPVGLLSTGDSSVESILNKQIGIKLYPVHRLDRDTTGCLIFAESDLIRDKLIAQFESFEIKKRYLALVLGRVEKKKFKIDLPIDGKSALSIVELKEGGDLCSFVEIKMETGRTHQIRKHLNAVRHPVLGDTAYFKGGPQYSEYRNVPRQMLHASNVEFKDVVTGARKSATAPLPLDFKDTIRNLLKR